MTEPEETATEENGPEDEEGAFWKRHGELLESIIGRHLTEGKFEAALDRWAAKQSAEIDQEEDSNAPKAKSDDDGGGPEPEHGHGDREPSDAERQREAGRVGRRARSPYYERVKGILY